MNKKELQLVFDDFLFRLKANRGTRLNPNDINDTQFPVHFLSIANDQLQHYSRVENDTSIYYAELTDSFEMDAFSFFSKGTGFIAVSFGSIVILRSLFLSMLSDPDSFTRVGNFKIEDKLNCPLFDTLPRHIKELNGKTRSPNCPMREAFSKYLTNTAFHFLVAHELGHLSNGHIAWKNTGTSNQVEPDAINGPFSPVSRQAMEMDADAFASRTVLSAIHRHPNEHAARTKNMNKESLHVYNEAFGTAHNSIYLLHFITSVFFIIWDDSQWTVERLSERATHPPSAFRNIWSGSTMQELIRRDISSTLAEEVTEIATRAYRDALLSLSRITELKPSLEGIMKVNSPEFSYYTRSILNHWANIRPKLEKFSKGGNLAPVQT